MDNRLSFDLLKPKVLVFSIAAGYWHTVPLRIKLIPGESGLLKWPPAAINITYLRKRK